jgi:hypothetical protein
VASSINAIQEPRLTTDHDAILLLTWLQGQTIQATYGPLRPGVWQTPSSIVMPPAADLRDIAVAAIPDGGVSVSWVQVNAASAGEVSLYESSHASVLKARDWLPLLVHP